MFAAFSSVLPSGISFSGNKEEKDKDRERTAEDITPRPAQPEQLEQPGETRNEHVDELGVRKERRRERSPNETFIVVRPPPSVSNHPLNLQLQLVPPQVKERTVSGASAVSNRRSVDYSSNPPEAIPQDVGVPLARTPSGRSGRSDLSSFYASTSASTTSMSSLASTASTSSVGAGRRMIVPLYNLSAHNVMTNTVLDAGTDAKVAKYHKRGMEILGLAVLECAEVWPSYGRAGTGHVTFLSPNGRHPYSGKENAHAGGDGLRRTVSKESDALHTPTSSALSLSSAGSHRPSVPAIPASPLTPTANAYTGRVNLTPTPSQSGAKKIFGRIFKKKDAQPPAASPTAAPLAAGPGHTRTASASGVGVSIILPRRSDDLVRSNPPARIKRPATANAASPTGSHFSATPSDLNVPPIPQAPTVTSAQPILQPPILGIQPILASPVNPPAGRPSRYVWVVKKWLKGNEGGLLGGVMRGAALVGAGMKMASPGGSGSGSNLSAQAAASGIGVEVRFEWVRGVSKSQKRKSSLVQGQGHARRASTSIARSGSQTSLGQGGSAPGTTNSRRSNTKGPTALGRRSGESRRSVSPAVRTRPGVGPSARGEREESASRDSRSNSMASTSATVSDEAGEGNITLSPKTSGDRDVLFDEPEMDDGEESDPEDSETPWTCSLVIASSPSNQSALWEHEYLARDGAQGEHLQPLLPGHMRTGHSPAASNATVHSAQSHESSSPNANAAAVGASTGVAGKSSRIVPVEAPGTLLRLKVGTLSPAPHHPKVVAQVKVPFPLPDVEIERARVRKRLVTPAGVARPAARPAGFGANFGANFSAGFGSGSGSGSGSVGSGRGGEEEGMVLTAEEIKDVLSCTAFWVVVREGFGGVGKVNRKGDGWRIRA